MATLTAPSVAATPAAGSVVLQASSKYTFSYNVINQTAANPVLNATLSITGFDTSSLTTPDGKSGLYLGLGFGSTEMKNVDAINCLYFWSNKTTDAFVCYDMYFNSSRLPVATPESQDAKNVKTNIANLKTGEFSVTFQRAFNTTDPVNLDYKFTLEDTEFIWSYGLIRAGAAVQHKDENSGDVRINIATGQVTSVSSSIKASIFLVALMISALFI
jgi:hypothetical protein